MKTGSRAAGSLEGHGAVDLARCRTLSGADHGSGANDHGALQHGTLRQPWGDRIAYVGDAAHRASPQLGQGANMALLDAAALAKALETLPLDQALPAYGKARRWHVGVYQAFSAMFTRPIKVTAGCCPFCATMCCFLSAGSRPFHRCCRI